MWEVEFQPSGKFRGLQVLYRDQGRGPGGPSGGATYPEGAHGLKWGGTSPWWAGAPPWAPLCA